MIATRRQMRRIRAERRRSALRGVLVVVGVARMIAGAAATRPGGYWSRRLGVDHRLGRFVRLAISRPVPR